MTVATLCGVGLIIAAAHRNPEWHRRVGHSDGSVKPPSAAPRLSRASDTFRRVWDAAQVGGRRPPRDVLPHAGGLRRVRDRDAVGSPRPSDPQLTHEVELVRAYGRAPFLAYRPRLRVAGEPGEADSPAVAIEFAIFGDTFRCVVAERRAAVEDERRADGPAWRRRDSVSASALASYAQISQALQSQPAALRLSHVWRDESCGAASSSHVAVSVQRGSVAAASHDPENAAPGGEEGAAGAAVGLARVRTRKVGRRRLRGVSSCASASAARPYSPSSASSPNGECTERQRRRAPDRRQCRSGSSNRSPRRRPSRSARYTRGARRRRRRKGERVPSRARRRRQTRTTPACPGGGRCGVVRASCHVKPSSRSHARPSRGTRTTRVPSTGQFARRDAPACT